MVDYKHIVQMLNGDKVIVIIRAENEDARVAFLRAFLKNLKDDDKFFTPENSTTMYNKEFIFSATLKEEGYGEI